MLHVEHSLRRQRQRAAAGGRQALSLIQLLLHRRLVRQDLRDRLFRAAPLGLEHPADAGHLIPQRAPLALALRLHLRERAPQRILGLRLLRRETCPVSTGGGTRRVRLVREEGRGVSG